MSMISEQVADLREKAQIFENSGCATNGIVKTFREAADTIEKLSAKLADVNMERSTAYYNDGWIPCSERLPKFLQPCFITVQYGGLVTTFRAVYWESHWSTENENFHLENVTAWMPAEPYKGLENK